MWDDQGHQYDTMMGGGGWMVGFAVLSLVLLSVATAAVLVHLFLHVSRGPHTGRPRTASSSDARLVLDARLARGEVTPEEYQSVRSLLDAG